MRRRGAWCTARRFQGRAPCVLGCPTGDDSGEHYMGCRFVREAGWRMLRLDPKEAYEDRKKKSMLAADRRNRDERMLRGAGLRHADGHNDGQADPHLR